MVSCYWRAEENGRVLGPIDDALVCPACGSERVIRNGHTPAGRQQIHCQGCGVWRQLEAGLRAVPEARQAEILRAVTCERLSLRAAERVFGVARQTIAAWIKKKPRPCRP